MRGAYFLIEATDSIDSPPDDTKPVVSKEIPDVTLYSTEFLVYVNLPANLKVLTPFPLSPDDVM